jgi:glycosyltransferase involved in cell wall biosynthesis
MIHVAYLAPSEQYVMQSIAEQERVRKKYSLPAKYLLYVGDVNWNKNIPGLLRSLKTLETPLVCVGKAFLDQNLVEITEINGLINSLSLDDKIIKLGFVPEDDLPALYTAAEVHVQPSFAEGFGLPVLESMACGTISVVAKATSLEEIAGPSILVNPNDIKDIAGGITKALGLNKETYRNKLAEWVKKYTWEKTVQATTEVYKTVLV